MQKKPKRKPTALRPNRGKPQRKRASVLRTGPARDPKYLAWIRLWPCIACWRSAFMLWAREGNKGIFIMRRLPQIYSEAMHTGPHGISQKASDHTALPGCRAHHHELDHQIGKAFWKKYGLNRLKIIAALRAQYAAERGK